MALQLFIYVFLQIAINTAQSCVAEPNPSKYNKQQPDLTRPANAAISHNTMSQPREPSAPSTAQRRGTIFKVGGASLLRRESKLLLSEITGIKSNAELGLPVELENSYRMAPDEEGRFISYKVEYIIKNILETELKDTKYRADHCSKLTQDLCSTIKAKTKQLNFHRYKLVVQVVMGQDTDQAVQVASRCLWNHATDNFAAATFRNNSLYAIAIVYGLYLE